MADFLARGSRRLDGKRLGRYACHMTTEKKPVALDSLKVGTVFEFANEQDKGYTLVVSALVDEDGVVQAKYTNGDPHNHAFIGDEQVVVLAEPQTLRQKIEVLIEQERQRRTDEGFTEKGIQTMGKVYITDLLQALAETTEDPEVNWKGVAEIRGARLDAADHVVASMLAKSERTQAEIDLAKAVVADLYARGRALQAKDGNGSIVAHQNLGRAEGYLEAARLINKALGVSE